VEGEIGEGSCIFITRKGLDCMTIIDNDSAAKATNMDAGEETKKTLGISC